MSRAALALVTLLVLVPLACRSIEVPPSRTPVPTPEATRTSVSRGTPTSTPTQEPTSEPVPIKLEEPVPFAGLSGDPITGADLLALLASSGLEVIDVENPFRGGTSICSSIGGELTDDFILKPGFRTPVLAIGDANASIVIGLIFYNNEALRAADWQIEPDGSAQLLEDGACAARLEGQPTFIRTSLFESFFLFGGWVEESAIGAGNIIAAFPEAVIGGNELGGNGLDPEMRAEVERLIRGLNNE
jgi:hypothetical protein